MSSSISSGVNVQITLIAHTRTPITKGLLGRDCCTGTGREFIDVARSNALIGWGPGDEDNDGGFARSETDGAC